MNRGVSYLSHAGEGVVGRDAPRLSTREEIELKSAAEAALDKMESHLDLLSDSLAALRNRMAPVINESRLPPECPTTSQNQIDKSASPFVERLLVYNSRLAVFQSRLDEILNTMEI